VLLNDGRKVGALIHRNFAALKSLSVERVHGDLLDVQSLSSVVDGIKMVFHAAASVDIEAKDPQLMEGINVGDAQFTGCI
jgi:FlaA1/EpsC-like NDP-sugar epimerase